VPVSRRQETTRVLTEASISGKIDHLRGLKENLPLPPPVPPQPAEDDLDLDREIEYAFDTDGLPRRSAYREGGNRCSDVRPQATSSRHRR